MRRYSDSEFQLRFSGLIVIYALLVAFVLPYADGIQSVPAKALLTVLPVVPAHGVGDTVVGAPGGSQR